MGTNTMAADLNNLPAVSELVRAGIEENNPGKSQRELAIECNYPSDGVSMLSMVKKGQAKMALNRVGVFAKVLKLDPKVLLLSALRERIGDDKEAWDAIRAVFSGIHSEDETPIIEAIRNVSKETGRSIDTSPDSIKALENFIKENMTI